RERQIGFWRRRLFGDVPVLRWPSGRPRPAGQTYRGKIRSFTLPAILSRTGRILGQAEGTTQFIVLLAAFYVLLHQYTGQTDLVVGTFSPAGRKRSEVQSLLGYFLNPVSLRIDISDHPSFVQLLRRTQRITSEALSNDDVPF